MSSFMTESRHPFAQGAHTEVERRVSSGGQNGLNGTRRKGVVAGEVEAKEIGNIIERITGSSIASMGGGEDASRTSSHVEERSTLHVRAERVECGQVCGQAGRTAPSIGFK
jgi:hypothetical protein